MTILALSSRSHPGLVAFVAERCGHRYARHVHQEAFSIGFVRAGWSRFRASGGSHRLVRGEFCAFAPGTPHEGGPDGGEPWDFVTLHVPAGLTGSMPRADDLAVDGAPREDAGAWSFAVDLMAAIGANDAEAEARLARDLVGRLYPNMVPWHTAVPDDGGPLPRSVAQLAERSGLHRCTFSRRFRASRGIQARAYLASRRVERAVLNIHAGAALADAAALAGFADQSHMTRVVRAVLGVPPGALRRQEGRDA